MANFLSTEQGSKDFNKKVWQVVGIVTLVVILIWLVYTAINVLLLMLMAILVSIFFQRLALLIQRKSRWGYKLSLAISIIGTILITTLAFWLIGARVQQQITELTEQLPKLVQQARQQIEATPLGKKLLSQIGSGGQSGQMNSSIQRFFTTSFGVLGDIYAILFLGIFFTISPDTYVNGFLKLVPQKAQPKAKEVLDKVGDTLAKWLKGQLFAMLVVAVLTGIGLTILGVPMALALAIIAGLLNFVPNFGPLISAIPAILVSLPQGGNTAILVGALYLLVQALESNLITPYIQNKMISIPPALILIGQMIFGTLFGAWGVILATPLVAILMVVLQELHVKRQHPQIASSNAEKPA